MEAAGKLRSTAVKFQATVDAGDCRTMLEVLEGRLHTLVIALEMLKYLEDADAIEERVSSAQAEWDAVTEAAGPASDACS
jgi:hypothetical protein